MQAVPAPAAAKPAAPATKAPAPPSESTPGPRTGAPEIAGSIETVHYSVTAPTTVKAGATFVLDVWGHPESGDAAAFAELQKELMGQLPVKGKGPAMVILGPVLLVRLKIDGVPIEEPQEAMLWYGENGKATFSVEVPGDVATGPRNACAAVHIFGLRVAQLDFTLNVGTEATGAGAIESTEVRHRRAFACHAAADMDDVVARVHGMRKAAPHVEVTLNIVTLRSDPAWETELLRVIPSHDVFYLFWSRNALAAPWVEKEWRCAIAAKGLGFIDPVPLHSPHSAPPPSELARGRFNEWVLAFRSGPAGRVIPGF